MKIQNIDKFNALHQRQKKYARTKTALLNALLKALETKQLSSIMIKDLAYAAEVSEPTFFNYFDSKQHMLVYFIQMWSIQMNALAKMCKKEESSYIGIIKKIFIKTAEEISDHPQIMLEIISFQAQVTELIPHEISDAEKWYFFQTIENVELLEGQGIESILPPLIHEAVITGELDKNSDERVLFLILSSLFFGTPLLLLGKDPHILPQMFEAELNLLFKGAGYEK